jgi:hypothetical protein
VARIGVHAGFSWLSAEEQVIEEVIMESPKRTELTERQRQEVNS